MIDIHSHILPGIDDGPATMEESIEIAVLYEKARFSRVVATPHWVPGTAWTPAADEIKDKIAVLNESLHSRGIGVHVCAGMEIAMDGDLAGLFEKGRLLSIAGSPYALIETPFQQIPLGWEQMFMTLAVKGYKAVLAHPERCGQMVANPDIFDDIVDAGAFLQANYDSFSGHYGQKVEETAVFLAQKGYLHCLATDSHDALHRHPGRVEAARKKVENLVGTGSAEVLCRINPERILKGLPLEILPVVGNGKKKKKRWRWF